MIIYRDILTGEELISDVYDLKPNPSAPGLWEADCKKITIGAVDVDTGANASAEGEDADDTQDQAEMTIDVVHSFRLQHMGTWDKKYAASELKKFAKGASDKLKEQGKTEQEADFKKTAQDAVKWILGNLKELEVYSTECGATGEAQGWAFLNYREDGITPYMSFFRFALEEYKV